MPAGRALVAAGCVSLLVVALGEGTAGDDPWLRLTTEDWQPGNIGDSKTRVPIKDLECEGPRTRILFDPELQWADVKERLHRHLSRPLEDPWLFNVAMRIQQVEPDECVLGITSTSAFLLPVQMPKFRNMARLLNSDLNFLVLNVTFYDTVRSGFPIFGVMDALATPDYRDWFSTEEAAEYFPRRGPLPGCSSPAAAALLKDLARARQDPSWRASFELGTTLFVEGEVNGPGWCPPAVAASLLLCALARAEAGSSTDVHRDAALRDVIELVSRAEEIVRSHSWDDGVPFGELLATPWHLWWLLHRLQLALPRLFPAWPWRRPETAA